MVDCSRRDKYRRLCEDEDTIPIFSRDWWLDAVCERVTWDVALVEEGGKIVGAMPYCVNSYGRFKVLGHPPLTQTLGPWLKPSDARCTTKLARQKKILQKLIDQLPEYDHFSQNWHYAQTNWLPFYWHGFRQTTRYTYVLPDLESKEVLWCRFQENIRSDIRKASHRFALRVREDLDLAAFLRLNAMTFARQNRAPSYTESVVRRLDTACAIRGRRRILIAEDEQGRHHAGAYIVWDEQSAYYLMGGRDSKLRNSGASSLCLWKAIQHAASVTKRFDFEGSMIESIERYFRAFGAVQMPYFSVSRTPSKLLRLRWAVSGAIGEK